jgi:voltage-gated potassium channel
MHALELFVIGMFLLAITVLIHAYGSSLWMNYMLATYTKDNGIVMDAKEYRVLLLTVVVLLSLHLLEVFIWASVYRLLVPLSEIDTLETAFYFSLVTFTSLGYGDVTLGPQWRILGGIEALNGVLLLGWTTAFLYAVLQRIWKFSHQK